MISQATQLLNEISGGDHGKCDQFFALVYDDFRRLAQRYIGKVDPEKDLQATEVVHEVYLRLIDQTSVSWKDRSHFFAVGAHVMRHVLVDNARKRMAKKRGGKAHQVSMDIIDAQIKVSPHSDIDVLAVDEALEKLARVNEQRERIVEFRFFGGLTVEETAEAMGVSKSTAEREWRVARAWLRRELSTSLSQSDDK
jgi:RNA polymerase sigma factor (TIGR02999 family)